MSKGSRANIRTSFIASYASYKLVTFFIKKNKLLAAAATHIERILLPPLDPISLVARNIQACIIITEKLFFLEHNSSHIFAVHSQSGEKNLNRCCASSSSTVRVESVNCFDGKLYVRGCKRKDEETFFISLKQNLIQHLLFTSVHNF